MDVAVFEKYRAMVDYDFLAAMDIEVQQAPEAPWQFFITHPDLKDAKFVYYPSTGSVVYETDEYRAGNMHADDAEELVAFVMDKVNEVI